MVGACRISCGVLPLSAPRGVAGAALLAALAACAASPAPADLVVIGADVYDGVSEKPFPATIAVRDGVFIAVDRSLKLRFAAARQVDASGQFVIPGLFDMHVHLANDSERGIDPAAFLEFGATSVRDAGGFPEKIAALRQDIASGARAGPFVYAVGPTLNGTAFAPFHRAIATEPEALAAVDELAAAGFAMIKVHRAFKPELLPALVARAHERGLKVTGHIPLGVDPLAACKLGMDGVEHVGSFIEALVAAAPDETMSTGAAIAYMESDAAAPIYDCFARRSVAVAPTLVIYPAVAEARRRQGASTEGFEEFVAAMGRITLRLHKAGAPIVAGTDSAYDETLKVQPGASLHEELGMLQQAGITAPSIIKIATSRAAAALGVGDRVGMIAPNFAADFVIVSEDPGADIANAAKIVAVHRAERSKP